MVEVRGGYEGRWAQAFCHYCNFASQSRDMEKAIAANARHERKHPEYKKPLTMAEISAEIAAEHAAHDCKPAPCVCICGCRLMVSCTTGWGPLCTTCGLRDIRGDEEHGEPVASADKD